MSLTSALFSGVSGLNSMSSAMTVVGDNIANVNTVGFKSSSVTFQDVLSQAVATTSGSAQVGSGTSLSDISVNFGQGSFESTNSSTDLAISGGGFFIVRDPNNGESVYYTRAGEFSFDADGNFVSSSGYIVQGWKLDETTAQDEGSITDINLSSFTSPPSATTKTSVIVNLDSDTSSNSIGSNTALSEAWDGSDANGQYIDDNAYEYQTTIQLYDSLGTAHDVTIYFDKGEDAANPMWEYIVTMNPAEDNRTGIDDDQKGMLARGTIEFSASSGVISGGVNSITCSLNDGDGTWTDLTNTDVEATDGYFSYNAEFISGSPMNIKLDFGSKFNGNVWANDSLSVTQYASSSSTISQSADGYGAGDLQSISVDTDGVITGTYSNGQVLSLYRVALADFTNEQGLYKEGNGLYSETRLSGNAITGKPNNAGLGSISPNSLEESNVDLASEFVKMIITQRGFQANSKVITVTDEMLQELINLKR